MPTNVIMPQLGESVVEGTVTRWLKAVGDRVERFEPLLDISTDKVDSEIPSPETGVLLAIFVSEGQTVAKGTLLALIGQPGEAEKPLAHDHAAAGSQESDSHIQARSAAVPTAAAAPSDNGKSLGWHVTPVVARMAAEHGLDLGQIAGSGRGGRVTKKDVEVFLAARQTPSAESAAAAPWERPGSGDLFKPTVEYASAPARTEPPEPLPAPSPGEAASAELVPLTPMRKKIAEHMVQSKLHTAPHVTSVWEIDLSSVLAHREAHKNAYAQQGANLTLTAYFVAASVEALRSTPVLNAEWRNDGILIHHNYHIGVAVALDEGLIVPVLKHAGDLNLLGIARGINDLTLRARERRLKPDDIFGGTFTISNHGVTGSLFATPIILQPQVAILGIGVVEQRVKVIDGMIAIRPCAYVSLTFDHRVADGAIGDAFMQVFKQRLEGWPAI
jgi:2-oxoglutarate dehydrogenase E2 component (dihydrolipoamide succinyltransferase)